LICSQFIYDFVQHYLHGIREEPGVPAPGGNLEGTVSKVLSGQVRRDRYRIWADRGRYQSRHHYRCEWHRFVAQYQVHHHQHIAKIIHRSWQGDGRGLQLRLGPFVFAVDGVVPKKAAYCVLAVSGAETGLARQTDSTAQQMADKRARSTTPLAFEHCPCSV